MFREIKTLGRRWWHAHTSLAFYEAVPAPVGRYLAGILAFTYLIYAFANTTFFRLRTLPAWDALVMSTWTEVVAHWPSDLHIMYDGQQLSASPAGRLTIAYPGGRTPPAGLPNHLATLDTTVPTLDEPHSLLSIGSQEVVLHTGQGTQTTPITELLGPEPFTLEQATLPQTGTLVGELWRVFRLTATLAVLIGSAALLILIRLLLLPLYAWIGQSLVRLFGVPLRWLQAWYLGLLLLIPSETIQLAYRVLYHDQVPLAFWWIFLILFLVVATTNHYRQRS